MIQTKTNWSVESSTGNIVDAILTAILQWRVAWLNEQKKCPKPPPICRTQPKKLKITYDNYKDYESTFIPLLMHEIWAQIFEECFNMDADMKSGLSPMDVDDGYSLVEPPMSVRQKRSLLPCQKSFWIGVHEYRTEGPYQCLLKCQFLIESNRLASHLKLIGEGDLVRVDLAAEMDPQTGQFEDFVMDPDKKEKLLSLFAYVTDVSTERITQYTSLAECFVSRPNVRNLHVVNYQVVIAKRKIRLKLSESMKMTCIYYLKPMIRQIESVTNLKESALAKDILSPKAITCQLSVPTVVNIKSPHYNDMQYKAIIGANEALVRNIPKIQLIQGPPGTGKTHTLIGIIKHFFLNWKDITKMPKILICTPSNGAIDEVSRRLYEEREFLKRGYARRSLRMVRVGNPDQIHSSIKSISLEELVEANAKFKVEKLRKKHSSQITELEAEMMRSDTEITNLRYTQRFDDIPKVEMKIAQLLKDLEAAKAQEEVSAKREVSDASKRNIRFDLIKNADVILTTLNSCQKYPLDSLFKGERAELTFHCVIVDEASQCCEPELLMPLCFNLTKMILIGDPMQLPATVISRHAQDFDFGRSMFERFFIHFGKYNPSSPIAMLTEQYRMHPDICHFPSMRFYDNRLISSRQITTHHPLKPYIMFDLIHGSENKSGKSSVENEAEASFVRNLLVGVLMKAPENSQVGVITPYKGQKRLITHKINNLQTQRNITIDVNTCDGFQGQEKDIIILSCVRSFDSGSHGSIGFLKSYQRVNVALTRAKHSMIICISARSLSKDDTWKALIDDARQRRFIHSVSKTPSSQALGDMIKYVPSLAKMNVNDFRPDHNSKLIRASNPDTKGDLYEPEFMMPMDID